MWPDVCRRHGEMVHVDAATTAGRPASARSMDDVVAGLDRADSVTWDAHKMLFCAGACLAFVFYREAARRFDAFHQNALISSIPPAPD